MMAKHVLRFSEPKSASQVNYKVCATERQGERQWREEVKDKSKWAVVHVKSTKLNGVKTLDFYY